MTANDVGNPALNPYNLKVGEALIKYIAPGKYGVTVVPPQFDDGGNADQLDPDLDDRRHEDDRRVGQGERAEDLHRRFRPGLQPCRVRLRQGEPGGRVADRRAVGEGAAVEPAAGRPRLREPVGVHRVDPGHGAAEPLLASAEPARFLSRSGGRHMLDRPEPDRGAAGGSAFGPVRRGVQSGRLVRHQQRAAGNLPACSLGRTAAVPVRLQHRHGAGGGWRRESRQCAGVPLVRQPGRQRLLRHQPERLPRRCRDRRSQQRNRGASRQPALPRRQPVPGGCHRLDAGNTSSRRSSRSSTGSSRKWTSRASRRPE